MPVSSVEVTGQLVAVLKEALDGAEQWSYFTDHGEDAGLIGTLTKLSAAEASESIGGTSIASHVHHTVFGFRASTAWIKGDRSNRDWQESWRISVVDSAGWQRLQEELRRSYQDLRQAIEQHAETDVLALGGAIGAIAHVAYHLGAIKQKIAFGRRS